MTTTIAPLDGKNEENTLLALRIQAEPGALGVVVQAVSRKAPDIGWEMHGSMKIPAQHATWEKLVSAFELTQQPKDGVA